MASQMLASVKGMSAHPTERGERVHDRGFLRGVTADPDLRQDADGRYLRLGVRHRLKRTADLDGEVDAEPGLKIPGAVHHCPGRVG